MKETCAKSCGYCEPKKQNEECKNEYDYCQKQAEQGQCLAKSGQWDAATMVEFCPEACGVCHIHLDERDWSLSLGMVQDLHSNYAEGKTPLELRKDRNKIKSKLRSVEKYMHHFARKNEGFHSACQLMHPNCVFLSRFSESCRKTVDPKLKPWMTYGCAAACGTCEALVEKMDPKCPPDEMFHLWSKPGDLNAHFEKIVSDTPAEYRATIWSKPNPSFTEKRGGNDNVNYGVPIKNDIWVVSLDNFISPSDATALIELSNRLAAESQARPKRAFCDQSCGENDAFRRIQKQFEKRLNVPSGHMASWQFIEFGEGDREEKQESYEIQQIAWPVGVRILTVLLFWDAPDQGGQEKVGLVTIPPKAGRVVIFPNVVNEFPNGRDDRSTYRNVGVNYGYQHMARFHVHQASLREVRDRGCAITMTNLM